MSNIPRARDMVAFVLAECEICDVARQSLKLALADMTRKKALRHAPARYVRRTPQIEREVCRLADFTPLTTTEIAAKVGLRNGGRVTEILQDREEGRLSWIPKHTPYATSRRATPNGWRS